MDQYQSLLLLFCANQILVSLFIVKVACDPINQHEEWGCCREVWDLMVLILIVFFFSLFFFLPIHLLSSICSHLSSNFAQHKGMNFRMRSNMRYLVLNYWCISTWPLQWLFPEADLYKFLPISSVPLTLCTDVLLASWVRMNAALMLCWLMLKLHLALWGQSNIFIFNSFIHTKSRHLEGQMPACTYRGSVATIDWNGNQLPCLLIQVLH